MKEITRIHLARTPFNVEIEAKKMLETYLVAIQKALGADDDTLREIEARIVEILADRNVTGEQAITTADVEAIEKQLGTPSDFADETTTETAAEPMASEPNGKRLMRDGEHGILGGVCAGIANYFGIDVIVPRLIAILLLVVTGGTALLVYAVLWLVIPPAKTAAEKLQMRGEPVTLRALKSEASVEAGEIPERSKPLVVILRAVLGLGSIGAGLLALLLLFVGIFARAPLFGYSIHGLVTDGVLAPLGGAYVAAIVAGLLFILLMAFGAYASLSWSVSKKLLISSGIVIVLGLASFSMALGLGMYGVNQVHRDCVPTAEQCINR